MWISVFLVALYLIALSRVLVQLAQFSDILLPPLRLCLWMYNTLQLYLGMDAEQDPVFEQVPLHWVVLTVQLKGVGDKITLSLLSTSLLTDTES